MKKYGSLIIMGIFFGKQLLEHYGVITTKMSLLISVLLLLAGIANLFIVFTRAD